MTDRPDIPEEAVEDAAKKAWELSGPGSDVCIRTAPKGDWPGPIGAGFAACGYAREILQDAAPALRNRMLDELARDPETSEVIAQARRRGAEEAEARIKRRFGEDSRIARWVKEKLDDIIEAGSQSAREAGAEVKGVSERDFPPTDQQTAERKR